MKLNEVFNILEINEAIISGSYEDKSMKYYSDIDMKEYYKKEVNPKKILKYIQDKVKEIQKTDGLWFIDFKGGKYQGLPIKWTINDLMRGYKEYENDTFNFTDIFYEQSLIKIDVVANIDNRLIEITNNYFFDYNNINTEPNFNKNVQKELLLDYRNNKENGNYFKAYKRLYGYFKIMKNKEAMDKLKKFLNSDIGLLNQIINQLDTLSVLINNPYKKVDKKIIINNLLRIREIIPKQLKYFIDKVLKLQNKSLKTIDSKINIIINELRTIDNKQVTNYINKLNLTKYIYEH